MLFGLFASQRRKTRRLAQEWLELADKVYHYRRDVMMPADIVALTSATVDLRRRLKEREDAAGLKLGIDALEAVLRRVGGPYYPHSSMVDNVEFFLVAAIVILGLRAFFVQPFKIPTNSMWPSYYGMTGEVFRSRAEEPGPVARAVRFVAQGARPRRVDAPASGEVLLPIGGARRGVVTYLEARGRVWLVFPAVEREYFIPVGNNAVATVRVPLDYDMDWTLRDIFFPGESRTLAEIATEALAQGRVVEGTLAGRPMRFLRTGRTVQAGERLLSFDILTGDNLFVDRASYHFVRPEVGQGFVFRTDGIDSPRMRTPDGRQVESYYIKRLAGLPGDELRIENFTLYRNGAPITGAEAFEKNARREDNYVGYRAEGAFAGGRTVKVPEGEYLPLGDNSANSEDGRYWGGVPAKDAVGRPLFIYYPFTRRWGPAR